MYVMTLKHKLTFNASQFYFKTEGDLETAIIASDKGMTFSHLCGRTKLNTADYCEVTYGSVEAMSSSLALVQEINITAAIKGEVKARQATAHLARVGGGIQQSR